MHNTKIPKTTHDVVIINNVHVKMSNCKKIKITNDKAEIYRKFKHSLNQGKNVIVVMCTIDDELLAFLKDYFGVSEDEDENEFFVSYTSDTGNLKKEELKISICTGLSTEWYFIHRQ